MRRFSRFVAAGCGVLFTTAWAAAQDSEYISTDTNINSTWETDTGIILGYDNAYDFALHQNGTSPTLNIDSGAYFPGSSGVASYNGSVVNVEAFTVDDTFGLSANDASTINLNGGNVNQASAAPGLAMSSMHRRRCRSHRL